MSEPQPAAPAAEPQRRAAAPLFRWTIVLTAGWALPGAALCHAVYESYAQPGGAGAGRPWPANAWTIAVFVLAVPALLATPVPVAALVTGQRFLRGLARAGLAWQAGWVAVTIAALAVQVLLVLGAVRYATRHGQLPGTGPRELAAGFVLAGAVMLAIMFGAAAFTRSKGGQTG